MDLMFFNEIWSRRSLIITMAIIDLKLRYRNSILGFFWTFLEPLLLLTVLYFVFTTLFMGTIEYYPLYLLQGLIIWSLYTRGTNMGMESILSKSSIVSQTYVPREVVVISAVITASLMFFFEFIVFFIFMFALGVFPTMTFVAMPLMFVILFIMILGTAFVLSSLLVYYRDIRSIWGVVTQAGFFVSPIIYTMEIFPENLQFLLSLNPMTPLLNFSRDVTIYNQWLTFNEEFFYLVIISVLVLIFGYMIFKHLDKRIIEQL